MADLVGVDCVAIGTDTGGVRNSVFCRYEDTSPDDLVAGCLRTTKHGDTAISAKGRNAIQTAIDEFIASTGRTGRDAVVAGNALRGFLIHNGVFIQGPVWKG